ncbi:MAG: NAD(P)/FAD-dependent oxidoreductase [Hyphomicrobiales bacterium]|nr:NAD(P)/FAD-dependent oxidoreductase [Hyphomicrobiales bacterium]
MNSTDVLVIGAGAAGMLCAIEASRQGRKVTIIDHAKKPGEKIRISGGGRCNFTNLHCSADRFISANPHFVKSALSQYTAADFISLVERHNIAWHEKELGQLFCDNRSTDIINMLVDEMRDASVTLLLNTKVLSVSGQKNEFVTHTRAGKISSRSLVVATGGKSVPNMGASGFGYALAKQFGVEVLETRPALVPFTFDRERLNSFKPLAGIAFRCEVKTGKASFALPALFTHRGLSGPAMLQISSYWREGDTLQICFTDNEKLSSINKAKQVSGKQEIYTWLSGIFPLALAKFIASEAGVSGPTGNLSKLQYKQLSRVLNNWIIKPAGTEGYRTAEVTLGGVDTAELNSRTMEVKKVPGLYFIGEVVDVTGWLGGYNFQWAWSSGWAAGQVV